MAASKKIPPHELELSELALAIEISPRPVIEPGRYIVGDTGILLTGVNIVKRSAKNFVGVDPVLTC